MFLFFNVFIEFRARHGSDMKSVLITNVNICYFCLQIKLCFWIYYILNKLYDAIKSTDLKINVSKSKVVASEKGNRVIYFNLYIG